MDLVTMMREARERTLDATVRDLDDSQMMGPELEITNPMLWEIAHVAWFYERWCLRELRGQPPVNPRVDQLWDSMQVRHDTRWDLGLPDRAETLAYMDEILQRCIEGLTRGTPTEHDLYIHRYCVHHEDMHTEAFTWTRQTLGYAAPKMGVPTATPGGGGTLPGDVEVPGGTYRLGAERDTRDWVFDNEKWAHDVKLEPFHIARAATTNGEFLAFVEDGGYSRPELWSDTGRAFLESLETKAPLYWKKGSVKKDSVKKGREEEDREKNDSSPWKRRRFDTWEPLPLDQPVTHVSWYEADAFCRWSGRRLPTEAEWEVAARGAMPGNLDWKAGGTVEVGAHPESDSDFGCRQMLGNVWEWTSDPFGPYPGFEPDMYKDYSAPWFHTHRAARGGCWATRSRLARTRYRNFALPHRRDLIYGFRTCASNS